MFVYGVILKIQAAAALYLKSDGYILPGKIGAVGLWENQDKIKLCWKNWFDTFFSLNSWSAKRLNVTCQTVFHTWRALPVVPELCVVFYAHGCHQSLRAAHK